MLSVAHPWFFGPVPPVIELDSMPELAYSRSE